MTRRRSALLIGVCALGLSACERTAPVKAYAQAAASSGFNCYQNPTLSYTLPADAQMPRQDDMNCFAWQQFIALNWKASSTHNGQPDTGAPASQLGAPSASGASPPKVWETYALSSDVFRAAAAPPLPFSQAPKQRQLRATARQIEPLKNGIGAVEFASIYQAFSHSWITAQNGRPTYYEVRLNSDEYDYIVANRLYDARAQWQFVQNGTGIHLPDGSDGKGVGAIEIKAAWLPLTDASLYKRFVTAQANIVDPATGNSTQGVVGLVGLHIIHKTRNAQQFVWATFEQIDNAPALGDIGAGPYTYYNPQCQPASDRYQCNVNTKPPSCSGSACDYAAPTQIVRQQPLLPNTGALNHYAQSLIRSSNADSVLQYYQLVSVMWPSSSTAIDGAPLTPLTGGNPQPPTGTGGLANTTLETYFQDTQSYSPNNPPLSQPSCLACHTVATISSQAVPAGWTGKTNYASDYSFLFGSAKPSSATASNAPRSQP